MERRVSATRGRDREMNAGGKRSRKGHEKESVTVRSGVKDRKEAVFWFALAAADRYYSSSSDDEEEEQQEEDEDDEEEGDEKAGRDANEGSKIDDGSRRRAQKGRSGKRRKCRTVRALGLAHAQYNLALAHARGVKGVMRRDPSTAVITNAPPARRCFYHHLTPHVLLSHFGIIVSFIRTLPLLLLLV